MQAGDEWMLAARAPTHSDDRPSAPKSIEVSCSVGSANGPTTSQAASSTTNWVRTTDVELVKVLDGDTIEARVDGVVERVRLIGINSPESGECFATEATAALQTFLGDRSLRLEVDTSDRDQYGRLLRHLWVDDVFVNEQMVLGGFAIARRYAPDTDMADRLSAAQDQARANSTGQWASDACGEPLPNVNVAIVEINYDAPGDDGQNLNGEWLVMKNEGTEFLDFSGWILKDESSSHRYSFPTNFRLGVDGQVKIFSGCGTDTTTELFWCTSGSAIWNNTGDTAFLLDPTGNVVVTLSY
jgi:micrococcal nuclease